MSHQVYIPHSQSVPVQRSPLRPSLPTAIYTLLVIMSWHLQIESRLLALHSSIEPFRNLIRDCIVSPVSTLTDSLSVEKRKQDSLRTERTQLTETNA